MASRSGASTGGVYPPEVTDRGGDTRKTADGTTSVVGLVHLVQAIAIAMLSNDFDSQLPGRMRLALRGAPSSDPDVIWRVPVGYAVALFLFLAAADHLLMAAPGCLGLVPAEPGRPDQLRPLGRVLGQRIDHDGPDCHGHRGHGCRRSAGGFRCQCRDDSLRSRHGDEESSQRRRGKGQLDAIHLRQHRRDRSLDPRRHHDRRFERRGRKRRWRSDLRLRHHHQPLRLCSTALPSTWCCSMPRSAAGRVTSLAKRPTSCSA